MDNADVEEEEDIKLVSRDISSRELLRKTLPLRIPNTLSF